MNRNEHSWRRLLAAARRADDPRDTAAPYGFATRVAAQAVTAVREPRWVPFERFALRGLLVAAAFGLLAAVMNFPALAGEQGGAYAAVDAIGDLLDLS
jgi:hypothetical protein